MAIVIYVAIARIESRKVIFLLVALLVTLALLVPLASSYNPRVDDISEALFIRANSLFAGDDRCGQHQWGQDPPRAPHVMDRRTIAAQIRGVCAADLSLAIEDEVIGTERCAFHVVVAVPDGSRILENVIVHLRDDRIVKQVDVEAWD